MKCPVLGAGQLTGLDIPPNELLDCLKEECALWGIYTQTDYTEQSCCCITAIALALSGVMNKLPSLK